MQDCWAKSHLCCLHKFAESKNHLPIVMRNCNLYFFLVLLYIACAFHFLSLLITSLTHFPIVMSVLDLQFFVNMLHYFWFSIFITSNNLIGCLHLIVYTKNARVIILFSDISSQLGLQIFYSITSVIKLMMNVFPWAVFHPFGFRWHVWWHEKMEGPKLKESINWHER